MQLGARFDWMEITADGHDDGRERARMALILGARLIRSKSRNGYAEAFDLVRGDDVLATVYGHSARAGEVHVVTTSTSCDEVVPVIREVFPVHRVSRMDSCVDFEVDYDLLLPKVIAFAERNGLLYEQRINSEGGATLYVGSRKSENFLRYYKKSEQLRQAHPERAEEVPDGIVRFELESRPGKRAVKEAASRMSAADAWGLGQWTADAAVEFLGIEAERVSTHFRKPSDWARISHYLGLQYSPTVAKRVIEVGREQARAEVLAALGLS